MFVSFVKYILLFYANQQVWLYWLRNISDDALPEADGTKDLLKSRVSSHEGLSPLSGPNINDKLGKSTADDSGDQCDIQMLGSDERSGSTTQSPTLCSEQPINVH
jgi:hypothetical protein